MIDFTGTAIEKLSLQTEDDVLQLELDLTKRIAHFEKLTGRAVDRLMIRRRTHTPTGEWVGAAGLVQAAEITTITGVEVTLEPGKRIASAQDVLEKVKASEAIGRVKERAKEYPLTVADAARGMETVSEDNPVQYVALDKNNCPF